MRYPRFVTGEALDARRLRLHGGTSADNGGLVGGPGTLVDVRVARGWPDFGTPIVRSRYVM